LWPFVKSRRLLDMSQMDDAVVRARVAYLPLYEQDNDNAQPPPRSGLTWAGARLHEHMMRTLIEARNSTLRNVVLYLGRRTMRADLEHRSVKNEAEMLDAVRASLWSFYELVVVIDSTPDEWRHVAQLAARSVVLLAPQGGLLVVRTC
jgi:hypothetical protein